jgi:hypothetical protein
MLILVEEVLLDNTYLIFKLFAVKLLDWLFNLTKFYSIVEYGLEKGEFV